MLTEEHSASTPMNSDSRDRQTAYHHPFIMVAVRRAPSALHPYSQRQQ
jgi:hypothetical protein